MAEHDNLKSGANTNLHCHSQPCEAVMAD